MDKLECAIGMWVNWLVDIQGDYGRPCCLDELTGQIVSFDRAVACVCSGGTLHFVSLFRLFI